MFADLDLFSLSGRMASHAANRQRIVAENIANSDTPSYRQRDIPSFVETVSVAGATSMRAFRDGHIGGPGLRYGETIRPEVVRDVTSGPNGNTVSIETEFLKTAEIQHQHEIAMAVYQSALSVLRTTMSNR